MTGPEQFIGSRISGRYQLEALLGRGGMGAVFEAADLQSEGGEPRVAVKLLLPGDPRASVQPRFLREARLAARLSHPNVVRVLDFGRWGPQQRLAFLVMPLVRGLPLEALLDAPLGQGAACELVCQLLAGLVHVHAQGIVHRDITPQNVLVSRSSDGHLRARLTDFGIARAFDDHLSARLTREGEMLGTPAYMAPEQGTDRASVGPEADLYSVGTLLHRMVCGRLPFTGHGPMLMVTKLTQDPPWPVGTGDPLDAGLAQVVAGLIARRPQDRFQTASEALAALEPHRGEAVVSRSHWRALGGPEDKAAEAAQLVEDATTVPNAPPGRERQLSALLGAARKAAMGAPRAVILTGALGVGKTTLVEAFVAARSTPHSAIAGFDLVRVSYGGRADRSGDLRTALERRLDGAALSGRGLQTTLEGLSAGLDVEALMGFLRPEPGASGRWPAERAAAALLDLLAALARARPVGLIIDHLGNAPSRELAILAELVRRVGEGARRLLVVVSFDTPAAPGPLESLATMAEGQVGALQRLAIEPPGVEAMTAILEASGADPERARAIAELARGHVSYAKALLRDERDARDALVLSPRHAAETRRILERRLQQAPQELQAAIHEIIEGVAAVGGPIALPLLEQLVSKRAQFGEALARLKELGLLVVLEGAPPRVALQPAMLGEALLPSLSERRFRRLHRLVGRTRAMRLNGPRPTAESTEVARHLTLGGRPEDALPFWLAGLEDDGRPRDGSAERTGIRLLAALDERDPRYAEAALALGRLSCERGEAARTEATLLPLLEIAEDPDTALMAGELVCLVYERRLAWSEWTALIARMQRLGDRAGPLGTRSLGRASCRLALTRGDAEAADAFADMARVGAATLRERCQAWRLAGLAAAALGQHERALSRLVEAVTAAEGHPSPQLAALEDLIDTYLRRAEPLSAGEACRRAIALSRQLELPHARARALTRLGWGALLRGRPGEASERFEQARRVAKGPPAEALTRLVGVVVSELSRGRLEATRSALGAMAALFSTDAHRFPSQALVRQLLHAWTEAVAGQPQGATALVEAGALRRVNPSLGAALACEGCGRVLAERGEPRGAHLLERAGALWQAMGASGRAEGARAAALGGAG